MLPPKVPAPTPASGRAVVVDVHAGSFHVPQVTLPNATAARRINRQLLRLLLEYSDQVDSMASPHQQVRQASRACCYDAEAKSWMAAGEGMTGTQYDVLLNQDNILSFSFTKDYNGLTALESEHLTFDLRTGRALLLADVIADPPAQLQRRLRAAIDRRLGAEMDRIALEYQDTATLTYVADEVFDWDRRTRHARATSNPAWPAIGDFALTPGALWLFYPIRARRLDIPFLPDGTYRFPYPRVKPRGLLVPVAQAATKKH
ncbi:hypothetical protein [Hymenobacter rubidus]|uniref:hypothetical protein n=1 Tax=Hymenobacter rubidus TaxID=1441626 RepID=UPI00191F8393|nr:hypothetical protein [Hymenobacter rubidus]